MSIFIVPLILVNFVLAGRITVLLERQLTQSADSNFAQTLQYLNEYISHYDILSFNIARIEEFQTLYKNRSGLREYSANESSLLKKNLENSVYSIMSISVSGGVTFYLRDEINLFANDIMYVNFSGVEDEVWFNEMQTWFYKHRRSFLVCPPEWINKGAGNGRYIPYLRTITRQNDYWDLIGFVKISIPQNSIEEILSNNNHIAGAFSCIMNYERAVIASSASLPEKTGDPESGVILPYLGSGGDMEWKRVSLNGQQFIVRQGPVGKYRINLVTFIPLSSIRIQSRFLQSAVMVILLILSLVAGFIFRLEFSALANRVTLIIDHMKAANKGRLQPITRYAGKDEIGQLIINYNRMVADMQAFAEYKYQSGMEMKSYEIQILMEQINPHFLYNTLEMINWLAKKGQNAKVSVAVTALARFYQASLGSGKNTVFLRNELDHVRSYIELQNMRFENFLDYHVLVNGELLDCVMPRTILQPIVENSIIHGILEKESGKGSITVTVTAEKGNLMISVDDDGVGMDAGETEKLNRIAGGQDPVAVPGGETLRVYGAANVSKRIQLMYGKNYGIHFNSTKGKGFCALITIPDSRFTRRQG
ncbi:histidine kinase [Spirochaetia bacterium]|nr:histidine kinase [Spirochaetia bacterium]